MRHLVGVWGELKKIDIFLLSVLTVCITDSLHEQIYKSHKLTEGIEFFANTQNWQHMASEAFIRDKKKKLTTKC